MLVLGRLFYVRIGWRNMMTIGGAFKYFLISNPKLWEMIQFDLQTYSSDGLLTTQMIFCGIRSE